MALTNPLNKLDIYNWMIIALSIFAVAGAYTFGPMQTLPAVLIAVAAANAFDIAAKYIRTRQFKFTKSATITGLFIGILIPFSSAFYDPIILAAIAIASKHLINIRGRHAFNPTLFAFTITTFLIGVSPSWWGSFAFPDSQYPMLSLAAVAVLGAIITIRQRRYDLVLPFVLVYAVGIAIMTMMAGGSLTANIVDSTTLFALVFMLVEPKTSPFFKHARIFYGVIAAAIFLAMTFLNVNNLTVFAITIANLFVLPLDKYLK